MKGHLLAIPKRHVEKLTELYPEERTELLNLVVEFQEKVLKHIATGCDIRQNYRPFQKQDGVKVNHLHIHILPRELKDELYERCQIHETSLFQELDAKEEKEIVNLLCA
jgi:diadenosine tetraphosphate (Ap4A) HIT family hydrolase